MNPSQWQDVTFGGLLRRLARSRPERTAVVDLTRRLTYRELDEAADRVAAELAGRGVRRGDRVVIQLPNRVEFLEYWFALQRLGAIPVHALPAHRHAEIRHLVSTSGATALIITAREGRFDLRAMAEQVCRDLADDAPTVIVVGASGDESPRSRDASSDVPRLLPVPGPDPDDPDGPAPGDLALLLISGGTTGKPKLIPRSHTDYHLNARLGIRAAGLDQDSVYLAVLPVGFNFTLACPGVLGTLIAGGTVVLAPDPSPATAFALIEAEGVTHTALTPALVPHWLAESPVGLGSLKVVQVGGARLPDELARTAGPALGVTIQQVYGMAEGLICYTALDDEPELIATTQGQPGSPDDELIVARPGTVTPVPPGDKGELLVRGPYTLHAYYRGPQPDPAFTDEGYYRTGDLVRQLPGGHLIVVGRVKDQVNRGGEKYAAVEVEDHLCEIPGIHAAAIVSVPDPDWGEAAVAVLVHDGPTPPIRTLSAHLRERGLAAYKAPQRVYSVAELPLTPVGKVDKQALRALLTSSRRETA